MTVRKKHLLMAAGKRQTQLSLSAILGWFLNFNFSPCSAMAGNVPHNCVKNLKFVSQEKIHHRAALYGTRKANWEAGGRKFRIEAKRGVYRWGRGGRTVGAMIGLPWGSEKVKISPVRRLNLTKSITNVNANPPESALAVLARMFDFSILLQKSRMYPAPPKEDGCSGSELPIPSGLGSGPAEGKGR